MKIGLATLVMFFLIVMSGCGQMPTPYKSAFDLTSNLSEEATNPLRFRFIDIGEGDATLITTPNGKSILIDAGTTDMGRERVIPKLAGSTLELIIASHFDSDHIGGIPEIIKGPDRIIGTNDDLIPTRGVLDRGIDAIDTTSISDYAILTSDIRFSLKPGDEFVIDGVKFLIIAQNGRFKDGSQVEIDPENENAKSISLLITYNDIKYLSSVDLPGPNFENQFEPYDVEAHLPPLIDNVDILHVSHHGSHNSTSKEFALVLQPNIAIISVGENDYGHPHPIVIQNLLEAGSRIYLTEGDWIEDKTDLHIITGDICLDTNGSNIKVDRCDD